MAEKLDNLISNLNSPKTNSATKESKCCKQLCSEALTLKNLQKLLSKW